MIAEKKEPFDWMVIPWSLWCLACASFCIVAPWLNTEYWVNGSFIQLVGTPFASVVGFFGWVWLMVDSWF